MAKKKQSKKKLLNKIQAPSTPHDVKSAKSLQNPSLEATQIPVSSSDSRPLQDTPTNKVGEYLRSLKTNPDRRRPFVAILTAIVFVGIFAGFNFYFIPYVMNNYTDAAVQAREQEEAERTAREDRERNQNQLDLENTVLNFEANKEWQVQFELAEFGNFTADLNVDFAPQTVENFIRLTYRDYYDSTIFHNMLEDDAVAYLQGGDKENRDGTGGKSAFYIDDAQPGLISDEIWRVAPQRDVVGGVTQIINTPELRAPSLYRDLDLTTGQVVYPKGTLFLVKENAPDSGRSLFGFTLKDSTLPANYTAFGRISESDFAVLDRILNEVNPVQSIQGEDGELVSEVSIEGRPEPEIRINSVNVISPQI